MNVDERIRGTRNKGDGGRHYSRNMTPRLRRTIFFSRSFFAGVSLRDVKGSITYSKASPVLLRCVPPRLAKELYMALQTAIH